MKKKNIINFIREITIVVFGVLIAVSINNYNERQKNQKYINKTLSAIEKEVNSSKEDVDSILQKNIKILEKLQLINDNQKTLGELISDFGGIQSPSIKNISLRFFISNKAELVDFEVISQLSEIEVLKNSLSEKTNDLIDFVYKNINKKDSETITKFSYYLANVVDSEKAILDVYTDFIENETSFTH